MMPCHSCHIFGIWRNKEIKDALKLLFKVGMQATNGDRFYGKGGFSLCSNAVLKACCTSYWLQYKIL